MADAGGTRHLELVRCLESTGTRFTVISSRQSYLEGRDRTWLSDSGNIEISPNLRVRTAFALSGIHRSFLLRVASFLSFSATSIAQGLRQSQVDVVLGTSPPIFQAVSALVVATLKRVPFVLEVRDLWPEFAIDMGVLRNRLLISCSRWLERLLYRQSHHIIVNSPAYLTYLVQRGVPRAKITVVPNGVDPSLFDPNADGKEIRERWEFSSEEFVVTYAGALGMANDIPTILHAAEQLRGHRIKVLLAGGGKERERLECMASDLGLDNVLFVGPIAKADIPQVLAASDACVATLMPIPMFSTTYPNKVFDYMAAGRPTILAIDGVIREVMEEAEGGICTPPGDSAALAEAVLHLASHRSLARQLGANARRHVTESFNRDEHASVFGETLKTIAERGRS
jgi:glycosyltransferase involved in cell wall biosynthesis